MNSPRVPPLPGRITNGMGGLMLMLTLLGIWLVVAAIMDWDWSLGTVDMYPVESTLGGEAIRWGLCVVGLAFMFMGMGGCSQ